MITYITFPTAAVHVTYRTALNESICLGSECETAGELVYGSAGTCSVEVLDNCTSVNADVCGTAYQCRFTKSASVGVTANLSALPDIDVGVCLELTLLERCWY